MKPVKKAAPAKKPAPKPAVAKTPVPAPKPRKLKAVARPPVTGANVRPLGVLPASARARGPERAAVPAPPPPRAAAPPAAGRSRRAGPGPAAPDRRRAPSWRRSCARSGRKLMKEMGHLESTVLKVNPRDSAGDLSGYSFHMADAGTDAKEREKAFQFASAEGRLLLRVRRGAAPALRAASTASASRAAPPSRGRGSRRCPTARLCRDCKEKEERAGRPASREALPGAAWRWSPRRSSRWTAGPSTGPPPSWRCGPRCASWASTCA